MNQTVTLKLLKKQLKRTGSSSSVRTISAASIRKLSRQASAPQTGILTYSRASIVRKKHPVKKTRDVSNASRSMSRRRSSKVVRQKKTSSLLKRLAKVDDNPIPKPLPKKLKKSLELARSTSSKKKLVKPSKITAIANSKMTRAIPKVIKKPKPTPGKKVKPLLFKTTDIVLKKV
jgi:hypothetical protein